MGSYNPDPYLERFDIKFLSSDEENRPATSVPVPSQENRAAAAGWSKGGNWMDQHEDINRIGQASPDIDIVFLGNSITQSLGGPGRNVWAPASNIRNEFFGHWLTARSIFSGVLIMEILII